MGQKTNSNLLRLGINNNEWKSKYFVQTLEESSLTIFNNVQLQTYLKQFLNNHGLIFHDYKFYYNTSIIHLYISYYNGLKTLQLINKTAKKQYLKLKKNNKNLKKQYLKFKYTNTFSKFKKQQKRNILIKQLKIHISKNQYQNLKKLKKNNFTEKLLESFNLFFGNKYNIIVTFQNLNSNLTINIPKNKQKLWQNKLLILKKYSMHKFFKETINILFIISTSKNSAQLFADFIAKQLTILKRHSFFLIFIKRILNLFIKSKLTKINGLKLVINGRFNGAPRARNTLISINNIPTQTLTKNINYSQTTAFSSNGTFGIKVWICEKSKKTIMFLQPKKWKYKKICKGRLKNFTYKKNTLTFGNIGLKSSESGLISARQLEAARQAIVRKTKRNGKLWIKIFPDLPITRKPTEVRMGKGKGSVSHWCARVKGGTTLFELCGIKNNIAISAFKTGSAKLPIKTKIFY